MNKNRKLVFISTYLCLALVLDYIKAFIPFLNMPSGGSINIALLPIVIASFDLGVIDGMIIGILWWLVSSVLGLNNMFISISQYVVDYVLPSGIIGVCAIFYKKKNLFEIETGILLMMIIRTGLLVISGAYFWPGSLASGSKAAFIFSLGYNLPYCLFTYIMLAIVSPIIIKRITKHVL